MAVSAPPPPAPESAGGDSPTPVASTRPSATYVDQSAEALALRVAPIALDPRAFRVLAGRCLRLPDLVVELYVIGASHLAIVRRGRRAASELLACQHPSITSSWVLERSLCATGTSLEGRADGLRYSARTWRSQAPAPKTIQLDEALGVVSHRFPGRPGGPPPFTALAAHRGQSPNEVVLSSLHWYENEGVAVHSSSRIAIEEAPWTRDR